MSTEKQEHPASARDDEFKVFCELQEEGSQ